MTPFEPFIGADALPHHAPVSVRARLHSCAIDQYAAEGADHKRGHGTPSRSPGRIRGVPVGASRHHRTAHLLGLGHTAWPIMWRRRRSVARNTLPRIPPASAAANSSTMAPAAPPASTLQNSASARRAPSFSDLTLRRPRLSTAAARASVRRLDEHHPIPVVHRTPWFAHPRDRSPPSRLLSPPPFACDAKRKGQGRQPLTFGTAVHCLATMPASFSRCRTLVNRPLMGRWTPAAFERRRFRPKERC